ncbi:MAG: hypothetical protein PHW87_09395 [Methanothrix sp.]|nr:hypothetical protein [Methanothrix sp.]
MMDERADDTMLAMVLDMPGEPLQKRELPLPVPGPKQILIKT